MYSQRERIAIFIDHDNLKSLRNRVNNKHPRKNISQQIWERFNDGVIQLVNNKNNYHTDYLHMGTWIFLGKSSNPGHWEKKFLDMIQEVDNNLGFIVEYGIKKDVRQEGRSIKIDQGVDTRLVCQMLIGAMEDRYDVCVLFSDDHDFIPVISTVQDLYGKKVYHAGYHPKSRGIAWKKGSYDIRAVAYSNIALEELDSSFNYK